MTDDISRWFEANIDSIARDILELVAVRSVSGDVAASRRALELALEKARSFGLSTRLEAEGRVGVAELRCDGGTAGGGEPETLGVLAHVDVVDPGDPASWSHDPWGELADGAVWGRGCVDDKGPLLICLWALRALRELGRPLRKNVSVIIGTMEEIDWEDLRAYKATGARLPDYGFTPDGAFPVTNREKGYCDVTLSFPADVHSGLGPWRIVSLEGGEAVNAVPEKAVAVLEETVPGAGRGSIAAALESSPATEQDELVVERIGDGLVSVAARGVATHSCFPGKGENAIVRLAGFLARLGPNGLAEFVSSRLGGDYLARGLGLQTRPEIVDGEYFGPTTVSPDLLSTAAGRFELTLNLRLAFGQTEEEVLSAFGRAGERYGFSARAEPGFMPALFVSKDRPYMRALMSAYERRTGLVGEFALDPGTSYAKAMPGIAAFGPAFPGKPDLCHEVDERLSLDDAAMLGQVYADAICSIAGSSEDLA